MNLQATSAVVFGTTALPVRLPFQKKLGACGRTRTYEVHGGTPDLQSGAFAAQPHMHVEQMKAERNKAANTLRGTLLPKMANSRTLAKHRAHHPSKAPCLHPAKSISIVKKLKERALSFSGKLPAPSILVNFVLRFGSGRPLPLY